MFDSNGQFTLECPDGLYLLPPAVNFRLLDASTAQIMWDGYGVYNSYRLHVSAKKLTGNPDYWKGRIDLPDTSYVATNLETGTTYYVYLLASLENGEPSDWVEESFVMNDPTDPCLLTIEMTDSYGDGWDDSKLVIKEGNDSIVYSMTNGKKKIATYTSGGGEMQIILTKSHYPEEVGLKIYNGEQTLVCNIEVGEALILDARALLYQGVACEPSCWISNLAGSAQGKNFSVTWDAENAASYEVAVVRTLTPRPTQLDSAAISVNAKRYNFTGEAFRAYKVYVRAISDKGIPQQWQNILLYQPITGNPPAIAEAATPVELSYQNEGSIFDDAVWAEDDHQNPFPVLLYSFNVADSVQVEAYADLYGPSGEFIFQLYDASLQPVQMGEYISQRLKGDYYLMLIPESATDEYYEITISKEVTPIVIDSLDFTTSGDFTHADIWNYNTSMGTILAYEYSYTATDSMNVMFTVSGASYSLGMAVFMRVPGGEPLSRARGAAGNGEIPGRGDQPDKRTR